jgi:chaperonin cofactor prefoldin
LYDQEQTGKRQLETMLTMIDEKRQRLAQQLLDINAVLDELDELQNNCQNALAECTAK